MLELRPNCYLVEHAGELPDLRRSTEVFIDCETTSGSPTLKSVNPWHSCKLLGVAITVDSDPKSYYVAVRHADPASKRFNLPVDVVTSWLAGILDTCVRWVNHNVKYDMHVLANDLGYVYKGLVCCTLAGAKLIDSDSLSNRIEQLAENWLGLDIMPYKAALQPYLVSNKDYGKIPADIMCPYACMDVIAGRLVHQYIVANLPADCSRVYAMESLATAALFKIERAGLRVNPLDLQVATFNVGMQILNLGTKLTQLTGMPDFNPGSPKQMNELLVNRLGLPVVAWNKKEDPEKDDTPSFGKDALAEYLVHPAAPTEVIRTLIEYRKYDKFYSAFLKPYGDHHIDGVLHPTYNQLVRTGRMSCSQPNAQQLNKAAKKLIIPPEGYAFLSADYAQIEFRLIGHYIQDRRIIEAFKADPDTDFHTWVAGLAGIPRRAAKTTNFLMAFGGGKGKLTQQLMKVEDLVETVKAFVDEQVAAGAMSRMQAEHYFNTEAMRIAESVYTDYHRALPNLKRTSRRAEYAARSKGYVHNLYHRRRHLPTKRCHIAFNTVNQSSAADMIKERVVTGLTQVCDSYGVDMVAIVHDEVLAMGPIDVIESTTFQRDFISTMEQPTPTFPVSVPIRSSYGTSRISWADAASDEASTKWPLSDSPWIYDHLATIK